MFVNSSFVNADGPGTTTTYCPEMGIIRTERFVHIKSILITAVISAIFEVICPVVRTETSYSNGNCIKEKNVTSNFKCSILPRDKYLYPLVDLW